MPFIIGWRHSENDEWHRDTGHIFAEGADASEYAKQRNAMYKQWGEATRLRVFPLPIDDPLAWRVREQARFKDGTYVRPPWYEEYGEQMFEHIDPNDPTKVRFYADEQDAHRNRYTSMAPGRFFARFIDAMPPAGTIERYCAKMGLDMTVSKLQIGKTADEFVDVYVNGPHSCMAYPWDPDRYQSPFHPVRVYGDLDLAVAYIKRGDEITGRTIVWPEKKIHGRIYGDMERMKERLAEEGYSEDWNFVGARLQLIRNGYGEIIAPYVDGDLDGKIEGEYLVLTKEPTIILKCPDGIRETESCSRCGSKGVVLSWDSDWDGYVCCPSDD